ncbi:EREBP-4 family protein [Toxoplasma gondii TgCatPRC2]|uniref:EREBP-4 family protein n=5 Tax=Toxoplasma gondii TaxID=5811 RepID=A0A125YFU0_TOXGV|nr:EREBP-4 family protein [Toxoplasma gondii ME49]ESS35294.1 EREBP-4 family protein [Toxoplasma gondii VEG]KFG36756.1 EREBP-4 family protein [Toxoplasma gondii GAB2-2007-GAL-DOM2]KYF40251.1 EREBP-4 family protein [Toxoplasma gondii ARI]KYK65637.1 EREBP-4 family protein [Toxoplasma gondii TgCatPRC2]EPT25686.1 EREBP-4 family protein [Toxoplasma gondii ME49]|eukprot:XP_002364776.2 EREBP-4 family protein [Toxoplasma gondii ME49]
MRGETPRAYQDLAKKGDVEFRFQRKIRDRPGNKLDTMTPIRLNVYRLTGTLSVPPLCGCCAAYHTGVQIDACEYTFAQGAGVVVSDFDPVLNGPHARVSLSGEASGVDEEEDAVFVYSLDMGVSPLNRAQIAAEIETLRREFAGENYHILERNCNHFCDELCKRLVGKRIPSYLNRAAWLGRWISCLFPPGSLLGPRLPEAVEPRGTSLQLFEGSGQRLGRESWTASSQGLLSCPLPPPQMFSGVLRRLSEQRSGEEDDRFPQPNSQTIFLPADDAAALEFSRALLADAAKARLERQKGR